MQASSLHSRAMPLSHSRSGTLPCLGQSPLFRSLPISTLPNRLRAPIPSNRPFQHPPAALHNPSAVVAAETTLFRVATGVPLVDIFHTLTVAEAAFQSAALIGIAVIAVVFGNQIIKFLGTKLEKFFGRVGHDAPRGPLGQFLGTVIDASEKPCQALLPWFGFAYCSTVISAFSEVAVGRMTQQGSGVLGAAGNKLMSMLCHTAQLMQDTSEVVLIIFGAWFFINLKNRLVTGIMNNATIDTSIDEDNIARIIFPVSSLISWATVVAATLFSLTALGINVKPLLALGSVSTLAIGFAAQSTVSNVVSAFSLYTARPFIAGDRIQLRTMTGATVVAGTVHKILPMHTIIQTDNGPPVFVHNKDVASSLLVLNESRVLRSAMTAPTPTIDTKITIRYKDVDKVAAIQEETTKWMKAHPDMLPGSTIKCALEGFDLHGAVMSVRATLKREAAPRKSKIITDILLYIERTIRKHGAFLATDMNVELPPPLTEGEPEKFGFLG